MQTEIESVNWPFVHDDKSGYFRNARKQRILSEDKAADPSWVMGFRLFGRSQERMRKAGCYVCHGQARCFRKRVRRAMNRPFYSLQIILVEENVRFTRAQ